MEEVLYKNRSDAARQLLKLIPPIDRANTILLGIPRGGVPMAAEMSNALHIPMDVLLVRKLSTPDNPEYAIGAVGIDRVWIEEAFHGKKVDLERWIASTRRLLEERDHLYRSGKPLPDLRNKTVILVDDGVATGRTLLLAIQLVRSQQPREIWAAVPVASSEAVLRIKPLVDLFICPHQPLTFWGVGRFYETFEPVDDEHVLRAIHSTQTQ